MRLQYELQGDSWDALSLASNEQTGVLRYHCRGCMSPRSHFEPTGSNDTALCYIVMQWTLFIMQPTLFRIWRLERPCVNWHEKVNRYQSWVYVSKAAIPLKCLWDGRLPLVSVHNLYLSCKSSISTADRNLMQAGVSGVTTFTFPAIGKQQRDFSWSCKAAAFIDQHPAYSLL